MKKLRDKDALSRHRAVDARARAALAELEGRICEAMDRWAGQVGEIYAKNQDDGEREFGRLGGKVYGLYGLLLL